ncbi:MAG: TolC family protein [Smithellaceae bacterium]
MNKVSFCLLIIMMLFFNQAFAEQSLTLEESKQLALQNNYKIKNSRLEIDAARERKKAAFTKYFPAVSAGGTMFKAENNTIDLMNMGILKSGTLGMATAVQPIFAGGRITTGNKLASLGEDVNKYQSRLSQNEVLLKTEEQYWLVASLSEKLNTIRKYEELLNSLLRQTEDAYNAGIILKNDLLKVKLKRSEVLLNKSKAENGKKLATMSFCQYIGIPYDSSLVLKDSLGATDFPQTYYIDNTEALKNRGEYKLLQASIRTEELQTKMKLGEYLPQAGVGLAALYTKIDEGKDQTTGMIFGTLSIPISGWWEASHTLSERRVKEKIAQNNFNYNSELLLLQMQKAWQDLTDAYKQVLLSEEGKTQAQENLKMNQVSYDNGLSNLSDLLEAQAMLQQVNDQLTDAKASYRSQLILYLQITGR